MKGRILTYHGVHETEGFRRQLAWLRRWASGIVFVDEMVERLSLGQSTDGLVAITFDDAGESVWSNAFAILRQMEAPATVFVSTDWSEPCGAGEKRWRKAGFLERPMGWSRMTEMCSSGLLRFASHGLSHQRLALLPDDRIAEELGRSLTRLLNRLEAVSPGIAYPFGSVGRRVTGIARGLGYRYGCTTVWGHVGSARDAMCLCRVKASCSDIPSQLKRKIEGACDWLRPWQRMFHKLEAVYGALSNASARWDEGRARYHGRH